MRSTVSMHSTRCSHDVASFHFFMSTYFLSSSISSSSTSLISGRAAARRALALLVVAELLRGFFFGISSSASSRSSEGERATVLDGRPRFFAGGATSSISEPSAVAALAEDLRGLGVDLGFASDLRAAPPFLPLVFQNSCMSSFAPLDGRRAARHRRQRWQSGGERREGVAGQ